MNQLAKKKEKLFFDKKQLFTYENNDNVQFESNQICLFD